MTLNLTVTRCACVLAACSGYYGYRARKYFAARYGERLRVVDGDSTRTVPSYLASHPEVRCDLIVVDGAHNYVGPVLDAVNLMHAGSCGTHLIMDDVCDPSLPSTTSELLVPSCPNKKGKWRKDRGTGKTVITNPYTRAQQEGQRDRESERNKKKEKKTKKSMDSCSTLES